MTMFFVGALIMEQTKANTSPQFQKEVGNPPPKINPKDIGVKFGRMMSEEEFLALRKKKPNIKVFSKQ